MLSLWSLLHKFKRYLMVGAFNTLLSLMIMSIGAWFGFHYLVYTAMGYLTTLLISFFMNLRYTFKVHDYHWYRLMGFVSVSLVNLSLVECLEYGLVEHLGFARWFAVISGMTWYVITGFLMNNFVIYRSVKSDNTKVK